MRARPDLTTAHWRKSTYSNGEEADCVEVGDGLPGLVPVRDSKTPTGPAVTFGAPAWTAFIDDLAR
ncbi:DUF397 domain-containing protein [Streptomyces clavuligerus]|uniref:DUF397 domain-containing protein n=1 Tax=Streptomyces clavuligerus TaxID=1901 RepID=UPI0018D03022|nr:DUF397 domain-containing protein [Streptomyces clavuligerus]